MEQRAPKEPENSADATDVSPQQQTAYAVPERTAHAQEPERLSPQKERLLALLLKHEGERMPMRLLRVAFDVLSYQEPAFKLILFELDRDQYIAHVTLRPRPRPGGKQWEPYVFLRPRGKDYLARRLAEEQAATAQQTTGSTQAPDSLPPDGEQVLELLLETSEDSLPTTVLAKKMGIDTLEKTKNFKLLLHELQHKWDFILHRDDPPHLPGHEYWEPSVELLRPGKDYLAQKRKERTLSKGTTA